MRTVEKKSLKILCIRSWLLIITGTVVVIVTMLGCTKFMPPSDDAEDLCKIVCAIKETLPATCQLPDIEPWDVIETAANMTVCINSCTENYNVDSEVDYNCLVNLVAYSSINDKCPDLTDCL